MAFGLCSTLASLLVAQCIVTSFSSPVLPNHRHYYAPRLPRDHRKVQAHPQPNSVLLRKYHSYQELKPYIGEIHSPTRHLDSLENITDLKENAERKVTVYENPKYKRRNSSDAGFYKKKTGVFENFVTPKDEDNRPKKGYEVTTKKFQDSEPKPSVPSALNGDSDLSIAIDEEVEAEPGARDPELLNPPVYVDSYGQLHQRPEAEGDEDDDGFGGYGGASLGHERTHGYGYGVVHAPSYHRRKKQTGRVRMQVFRGPTRTVGHKKFAQWGYYVVQPADSGHHLHSHKHPYW